MEERTTPADSRRAGSPRRKARIARAPGGSAAAERGAERPPRHALMRGQRQLSSSPRSKAPNLAGRGQTKGRRMRPKPRQALPRAVRDAMPGRHDVGKHLFVEVGFAPRPLTEWTWRSPPDLALEPNCCCVVPPRVRGTARVGQTDASRQSIDRISGRTFAGFDDISDCVVGPTLSQEAQRLRKGATGRTSRAKLCSGVDLWAGRDHFQHGVRAARRDHCPPGSNPSTDGKHPPTLVQHGEIEGESHETRMDRTARDKQQATSDCGGPPELPADEPRPIAVGDVAVCDDRPSRRGVNELALALRGHSERRMLNWSASRKRS